MKIREDHDAEFKIVRSFNPYYGEYEYKIYKRDWTGEMCFIKDVYGVESKKLMDILLDRTVE